MGDTINTGRPRARDIGLHIGHLPTGPLNAITDVAGVLVGHTTIIRGEGALQPGIGPVRTGVTVILPHAGNVFRDKVPAAIHVVNGFGKCMGQEQVEELGNIEGPIALTGTLNVGLVTDALVAWSIEQNPDIGIRTSTMNPVVGETSDAWLNDMHGRHVRQEHVFAALDAASSGPVDEGAIGAGTGMMAFGYKGGIGTASRVTQPDLGGWTVGVLVQANFGRRRELTIDGVKVGELLEAEREAVGDKGSIMIVVATDAPLLDRGLRRLARRAGIGLARTGSIAHHGSGDYVIAFSSAPAVRIPHEPAGNVLHFEHVAENGPAINELFLATVEATEEAIINALFRADTMTGRDGHVAEALPLERVQALLQSARRLRL
ncbi:MAG: aminopeptidase [Chloroflexi bacterium]|nr:MAG: aminopeptidase [Chloroflexota bacterium]